MPIYIDQLQREINIPAMPKRIISVVPSQTELLFDLGLDEEIIGITKFCIHPAAQFKIKPKIGGTKQLNIQKIKELVPDLIIANKEENERSQIEELMSVCPVWISDIKNLDEALDIIVKVGEITGKAEKAQAIAQQIQINFNAFRLAPTNKKVAYFIWKNPYMVAGADTFINDMLKRCGLTNIFAQNRYPEVSEQQLIDADLDLVLLSSEPYPFKQQHIDEFQAMLPNAKVQLVDGEMFSWYGSRMLYAAEYFGTLLR